MRWKKYPSSVCLWFIAPLVLPVTLKDATLQFYRLYPTYGKNCTEILMIICYHASFVALCKCILEKPEVCFLCMCVCVWVKQNVFCVYAWLLNLLVLGLFLVIISRVSDQNGVSPLYIMLVRNPRYVLCWTILLCYCKISSECLIFMPIYTTHQASWLSLNLWTPWHSLWLFNAKLTFLSVGTIFTFLIQLLLLVV